jgi:hypothetical protein
VTERELDDMEILAVANTTMAGQHMRELISEVRRLREKVQTAEDVAVVLEEILTGTYEGSPCDIDHNGFCQSHACHPPCLIDEAREALVRWNEVRGS